MFLCIQAPYSLPGPLCCSISFCVYGFYTKNNKNNQVRYGRSLLYMPPKWLISGNKNFPNTSMRSLKSYCSSIGQTAYGQYFKGLDPRLDSRTIQSVKRAKAVPSRQLWGSFHQVTIPPTTWKW